MLRRDHPPQPRAHVLDEAATVAGNGRYAVVSSARALDAQPQGPDSSSSICFVQMRSTLVTIVVGRKFPALSIIPCSSGDLDPSKLAVAETVASDPI